MFLSANKAIRERIKNENLKYWMIAYQVGIDQSTFSRWLRIELPEEKKKKILEAIDELTLKGTR